MFEFTKTFTFSILSSIVVGALAFGYYNSDNKLPSEDGFNEFPMSVTEYMLQREVDKNPEIKGLMDNQEGQYRKFINKNNGPLKSVSADFTLPVVFHIIHENGAENIDNAQIETAIEHLNDAFENAGFYDQGSGVNTEIEFCLAKTTPEGEPSTGVTRVENALTNMTIESDDLDLKNLDRWDPTKYINVWVVRTVSSDAIVNWTRGYSFMPAFHGTDMDGIVMEAEYVGNTEENSAAFVREMGHYLGLYSTFNAGCGNDDCLQDGDRVCDTPPDWTIAEAPCEVDENSCFTDVNAADVNNPFTQDENDLRENFMDINPLACQFAFTQGQADRMTFFINNDRVSLVGSTVCDTDCDTPIEDLAITPANDTTIVFGVQTLFSASALNATTYTWTLGGVQIGTGTNLVYNFPTAGVYTLTVTASNADSDCTITESLQVTVIDCFGNTWVDDALGVDVFMCGQPGSPCKTIQYALDNSVCSGDTIFIRSGNYLLPAATPTTTPIAMIPEDYTVTFFGVENSGPINIDGGGVRRAFVYDYSGGECFPSSADNGIHTTHAINFAHLTIQNCFSDEQACTNGDFLAAGSAMYLSNTLGSTLNVSLDDCRLVSNNSTDDLFTNVNTPAFGAIYFDGKVDDLSVDSTGSSITVTASEFTENRAIQLANGGVGGALSLFYVGSVNVSGSYFCENSAEGLDSDAGDLAFNRNAGGAIAIFDKSTALVPNNNNHSIDNCYFLNNEATAPSGIAFPDQSEGGALFLGGDLFDLAATSSAVVNITNSSFFKNENELGIEHFDSSVGSITESGNIISDDPFMFSLGNDTTICNIDSITIGTEIPGAEYAWSTGASTATITVSDTGMYTIVISMGACEFEDSIQISEIVCGEICGNGIDDDGDGLIDCFDPECCGQLGCDTYFYNDCANACDFNTTETEVEAQIVWQSNITTASAATPITADVDGDGIPEVFVPEAAPIGNVLSQYKVLDGRTGTEKMSLNLVTGGAIPLDPVIADVDKDGTAEIFIVVGSTIFRFEHDGTLTASNTIAGGGSSIFLSLKITDLNGDGNAELLLRNNIIDANTLMVITALPPDPTVTGVAADLLPDAFCANCEGQEIVVGNSVYSVNLMTGITTEEVTVAQPMGVASVVDFDKDGDLDAVVTSLDGIIGSISTLVYVWDIQTNTVMNSFDAGDNPSPAVVADFDGDDDLEISFKTINQITTLENDFSVKWTLPIVENGVNLTSSVAFDFDGDGDFEIVDRDASTLRIIDGTNGNVMWSDPLFSVTVNESPVVVDVDGDGLTEIVVSGAGTQGSANFNNGFIRAYGSSTFPWQTTRNVWNQFGYFNVNIQDDLSLPIEQQGHHLVGDNVILNNFQTQHGEQIGSDAYIASVDVLCALNDLIVNIEVCNSGENVLSHTTPITFYSSDPTAGAAVFLDTELLGVVVPVDSCRIIEFVIPAQYDDPIFAVVNDDNTGITPYNLNTDFPVTNVGECDYSNNMFQFTEMPEPYELDLGNAITICDNAAIELNASSNFVSYEWQDGTTDSTFTAYDGGEYWVTVIDSCGGTQTDTVQLIVDPTTLNMTEPSAAVVCPTQDTSFTVVGDFDTYVWIPNDFLDCDTCETVNVIDPDENTQYIVTASNSMTGCYSVDTVQLIMAGPINTSGFVQVCIGESAIIHGNSETVPGTYSETFTSLLGCDSISTITLTNFPAVTLTPQSTSTCPEGSEGSVTVSVSNGVGTNYDWSIAGAGNNPTVNNLPAGTYTVTVTDGNNCTSEISIDVDENTIPVTTAFVEPSCPGESDGELEITNGQAGWTYSLDGGPFQMSPFFMNLSAGSYMISVQDGDCLYTNVATGVVNDPAGIEIIGLPVDPVISFPDSLNVNVGFNSPNLIESIQWSPSIGLSCDTCSLFSALPLQPTTTYTITVTDVEGCTATFNFTLTVMLDCMIETVEIPNVFTPNGDGVNDVFTAETSERFEEVFSMRIYNRWGNVVYSADDGTPWDGMDGGKQANSDVYIYVMELGCSAGGLDDVRGIRKGDVTLIR